MSVALGELAAGHVDPVSLCAAQRSPRDIAFAKLGLAGCADRKDWIADWQRIVSGLPEGVAPVAVVYADWQIAAAPPPEVVIDAGGRLGCRAMLIDTFDKRGPGLLGLWSIADLRRQIAAARRLSMIVVLAGQVRREHLPQIVPLAPEFVAVRGAVCRGDRSARIAPDLVRELARELRRPLIS